MKSKSTFIEKYKKRIKTCLQLWIYGLVTGGNYQ